MLAILLLHANQVVDEQRIFELAWGEQQPPSVRVRLRVCISELRTLIGHDVIVRDGRGYRANVRPGELDLQIFLDAVAQAQLDLRNQRAAEAARRLRSALGLWNGSALSGVSESLAKHHAPGIEEHRSAALEDLFEAELAAGRHAAVVGELRQASSEHPLRTRLTAQLMLALHRCGRDPEALDVYAEARRMLVGQLGIEPSKELRDMQLRVLHGDPGTPRSTEGRSELAKGASGIAPKGNLPAEMPGFVGRAAELEQAQQLLTSSRTVTLIGVGGVGKTRLAMRVAHQVEALFLDGVWLAELADLPQATDASLLEQTVAETFGLSGFSPEQPADALIDHLRGRQCLLVLDNCEHLVAKVSALVTGLLGAAPGLHVLATSREMLGCIGEHVLPVPPLGMPKPGEEPGGEALELLRRRALACGTPVPDASQTEAMELCRRLDGLPLAIELAVGRLHTLSVQEVLQRIDDRFRLLINGARRGPGTHQTLLRAIDWSYQLCSEQERRLWERLAVFSGSFELGAVEDVCSGEDIDAHHILDLLTGLARKSLLVVDTHGRNTRYRLLETLRRYGAQELAKHNEDMEFRRRHRDYYRRLAAESAQDWFSSRESSWLEWARSNISNLRSAIQYGLTEDGTASLEMAINLTRLRIWFFIGWPGEGRSWLEQARDTTLASPTGHAFESHATALAHAGWMSLCQGDTAAADENLHMARAALDRSPAGPSFALALLRFLEGTYALFVDSDTRAIQIMENVLETMRNVDASSGDLANAEFFWAMAAGFLGDREIALTATERHLQNAYQHDAEWQISWARWMVGVAHARNGDHRHALAMTRDALRRQQNMGDKWGSIWSTHTVAWAFAAWLHATEGTPKDARRQVAEATARVLGGAQRLREESGVGLMGPYRTATDEAERAARAVLDDASYTEACHQGRFPTFERTEANHRILSLALTIDPFSETSPRRVRHGSSPRNELGCHIGSG